MAAPGSNDNGNGWTSLANWKHLRAGMSKGQVQGILGPPSSQDAGTYYYRGIVEPGGELAGHVCFSDEQVSRISRPYFGEKAGGAPKGPDGGREGFAVGDLVRLKGIHGPVMVVSHDAQRHDGRTELRCMWFDTEHRLHEHLFALGLVENAQAGSS